MLHSLSLCQAGDLRDRALDRGRQSPAEMPDEEAAVSLPYARKSGPSSQCMGAFSDQLIV